MHFSGTLSTKDNVIFATIHGDCHSISDIATLKNYSDLWLTVTSPDFKRTEFVKRHSKGKVEFKKYNLDIENFVLKNALLSTKVEKSISQGAEALPTSTFNLQLNEKEREDRSQLEMPYWKDKKDPKIEYIPDDNDDWDDEDPDDDLDI